MDIKLNNNNVLKYINGKWYRNNQIFTPYVLSRYKFFDKKTNQYMQLQENNPNPTPYTPNLNKLKQDSNKKRTYTKFLPSQKVITLKTKGKMNLADIPVNLLDSIAINTGRSNTNIKNNLGLIGKESTFGGKSKALGNPVNFKEYISPYKLTNNHSFFVNPEKDYYGEVARRFNLNTNDGLNKAEENVKYAYNHNGIKSNTKQYHNNILADAFARYADNPKKYNPGQSNYTQMVTNIGNEVWNDPQIQNWWNTSGRQQYNIGLKE